jgi:hypothetical protein
MAILVDIQVKTLDFMWLELPGIPHRNLPFHDGCSLCFYMTGSENQVACDLWIPGSLTIPAYFRLFPHEIHPIDQ